MTFSSRVVDESHAAGLSRSMAYLEAARRELHSGFHSVRVEPGFGILVEPINAPNQLSAYIFQAPNVLLTWTHQPGSGTDHLRQRTLASLEFDRLVRAHRRAQSQAAGPGTQDTNDGGHGASASASPAYLACDAWGHIFVGVREERTRWVLDRRAERLVIAQVHQGGAWAELAPCDRDDLLASLADNGILDGDQRWGDFEIVAVDDVPSWAEPQAEVHPSAACRQRGA